MKGFLVLIAFALVLVSAWPAVAADMTLEYLYRYNCQPGADHLLTALAISTDRAIVGGNQGLALLDLNALPSQGTSNYLYRLTGVNARNLYLKGSYVYVNLHRSGSGGTYGFAVVRINGDTLQHVKTVGESGVFYEKMCISGDYLYVAAHNKGIRIFNISNPANPVMVGGLSSGFTHAFAIAVFGNNAYVADGAGGLKIVDVTDRANPFLTDGEDLSTAVGTAEAITGRNGKVYMTVGGEGLAVYEAGNINSRSIVSTGGFAEDLCWVGSYLAVSTYPGVVVFQPSDYGDPTIVAQETSARRGPNATLRICCGIGRADYGRVMAANWNYVDIYRLKPASWSTQPDINSSEQRIRFTPAPGAHPVTLYNNGRGALQITGVSSTSPAFSTDYSGGTLLPGQSVSFDITYNGSPTQGSGTIRVYCNDPDENPLPIQVFGNTAYLDPTEPAIDFTLPILSKDPETGEWIQQPFKLSNQRGKVVWFAVYASW